MSPAEPSLLQVEIGLVENFCTLLCLPGSGECVLCDPAFEIDRLLRLVDERGLSAAAVLLTHSHPDHIDGLPELVQRVGPRRATPLPIYVGDGEAEAVRAHCEKAGVTPALVPLAGGEQLQFGAVPIEVLATPGHTRAGRSYYLPTLGAVLTGDTLFVGSCGRPERADTAALLFDSLQRLAALPETTRIYPGHDYGSTRTSTIFWESEQNPYLRCADAAAFAALCRARIGR